MTNDKTKVTPKAAPAKATPKAAPTKVDAAAPTTAKPSEKAPAPKAPKPAKSEFVDVVVKVHGLEDYTASGKRAPTMKTVRAWIRGRAKGLSVRLEGVTLKTEQNVAQGTDRLTYIFSEATLKAAGIEPKAPEPRGRKPKAEGNGDAGTDAKATTKAQPKVNVAAEKPTAETKPSDW